MIVWLSGTARMLRGLKRNSSQFVFEQNFPSIYLFFIWNPLGHWMLFFDSDWIAVCPVGLGFKIAQGPKLFGSWVGEVWATGPRICRHSGRKSWSFEVNLGRKFKMFGLWMEQFKHWKQLKRACFSEPKLWLERINDDYLIAYAINVTVRLYTVRFQAESSSGGLSHSLRWLLLRIAWSCMSIVSMIWWMSLWSPVWCSHAGRSFTCFWFFWSI